jgi:hypothetical protein
MLSTGGRPPHPLLALEDVVCTPHRDEYEIRFSDILPTLALRSHMGASI